MTKKSRKRLYHGYRVDYQELAINILIAVVGVALVAGLFSLLERCGTCTTP